MEESAPFERPRHRGSHRDDAAGAPPRLLDRFDGGGGDLEALGERQRGVERRVAGRREAGRMRESGDPGAAVPVTVTDADRRIAPFRGDAIATLGRVVSGPTGVADSSVDCGPSPAALAALT